MLFPFTSRVSTRLAIALLGVGACSYVAWAAESHIIVQKGRAFAVPGIDIARGDSITFDNQDDFLHQIFIASSDFSFDSPEQEPGKKIEVKFPTTGQFEVHCHIHPKMQMIVNVR